MRSPDGAVHVVVNGRFYGYHGFASVCEQAAIAPTDSDGEIARISSGARHEAATPLAR